MRARMLARTVATRVRVLLFYPRFIEPCRNLKKHVQLHSLFLEN